MKQDYPGGLLEAKPRIQKEKRITVQPSRPGLCLISVVLRCTVDYRQRYSNGGFLLKLLSARARSLARSQLVIMIYTLFPRDYLLQTS